jgi:hypothetical protein
MGTCFRRSSLALLLLIAPVCLVAQPAAMSPGGFPEGDAAIEALVLHFDPDLAEALLPAWCDLSSALDPKTRIIIQIRDGWHRESAAYMLKTAGFRMDCVELVNVGRTTLSIWARDRMVAIRHGEEVRLVMPLRQVVAKDRVGDLDVARTLVSRLPRAKVEHSSLLFEGGSLLFSGRRVLVTQEMLDANGAKGAARHALRRLRSTFQAEPLVVDAPDGLPHEHLDMFMTVVDSRTLMLGDPVPGARYLADIARLGLDRSLAPADGLWRVQDQYAHRQTYDQILRDLEKAGFRVLRVPVLHGDPDAMLSWNNALVELRDDGRHAFIPVYGVPELDKQAFAAFQAAGCRVWPIRAAGLIKHGGAVHCITNVVSWRLPGPVSKLKADGTHAGEK